MFTCNQHNCHIGDRHWLHTLYLVLNPTTIIDYNHDDPSFVSWTKRRDIRGIKFATPTLSRPHYKVYFYDAKFIQNTYIFNLTFGYIEDFLWYNNPYFANAIPLIFPKELEIKKRNNRNSFLCLLVFDIYLKFYTIDQLLPDYMTKETI